MVPSLLSLPPLSPSLLSFLFSQDLTVLQHHDCIKQLGHVLKINVRACTAVGHPFVIQVLHTLFIINTVCVCVFVVVMKSLFFFY